MQEYKIRAFRLTENDIENIKNGDIETIARFVMENEKRLRHMASAFAYRHGFASQAHIYDVDDMLSQLILDAPYLCYNNDTTLRMDILYKSFAWSAYGGYAQRREAGAVCNIEGSHMPWNVVGSCTISIDAISDDKDADNEKLQNRLLYDECVAYNSEKAISNYVMDVFVKIAPYLSDRQSNFMLRYLDGLTLSQIADDMGVTYKNVCEIRRQAYDVLIRNYREICAKFPKYKAVVTAMGVPPSYDEVMQRIAKRAEAKARYNRKKAEKNRLGV